MKDKKQKKPNKPTQLVSGKVAILKREDFSSKKTITQPPGITAATANSPAISEAITKEDVEIIVRKAVSSHFQKQENLITAEIQKAVRYEVQAGLVPTLNKTVAQTLEQTIAKTMKTNVTKTVKECMKVNTSELASSVSTKLQEPITDSFHQSMRDIMVPSYEAGTRQMFEQISSFVESAIEVKQKEKDESAKLMDGMMKRMDAMSKTMEVLIKAVAQLQTNVANVQKQGPSTLHPSPSKPKSVDQNELVRGRIVALISSGDYEKAFTEALSVSNSAMALFTCKQSDLSSVLEGNIPALSQPILLCLMQQLGSDLLSDEDLNVKLAWLQSIAVTLDPRNESIKLHIKGVCLQLVRNLQAKMQMSENAPALRRHLQMLLQVIRGIGNS